MSGDSVSYRHVPMTDDECQMAAEALRIYARELEAMGIQWQSLQARAERARILADGLDAPAETAPSPYGVLGG